MVGPNIQQENVFTGADIIIMMMMVMVVARPDNPSTCEGEICLNIGRSYGGVRGGQGQTAVSITTSDWGFYLIQHTALVTQLRSCIKLKGHG